VENSDVPLKAEVEANEDGVDPSVGVEGVPNGVVNWVCPNAPKRLSDGDGDTGVEKRLDEDGAETGVAKVEKALVEVMSEGKGDCCGWLAAVAGAAICAVGCAETGKWKVGWTLLAAASSLASSLLFASRNGLFPLLIRRCSLS
jgi:hypothetical protein